MVGTASYTGAATGLYMKKTFDQDGAVTPVSSGQFTADASLTATFGQVNDDAEFGTIAPNLVDTMTGTIDSFRDGYGAIIDEAWSAELMKVDIVDDAFTGNTTGGGSYTGLFYGDSAVDVVVSRRHRVRLRGRSTLTSRTATWAAPSVPIRTRLFQPRCGAAA